jgi:branched-chain amino acid transport system permease protein
MIEYGLYIGSMTLITAGMLAGQQMLLFDCGLLCLGTAAFFACGAYVSALFAKYFALTPYLSIIIAMFFCGGAAFLIGIPFLRFLKGDFFALATLGLAQATLVIIRSIAPGGAAGMAGIPEIHTFPINFIPPAIDAFLICFSFCGICFLIIYYLRNVRFGLLIRACRDDENAIISMGYRALMLKVEMFVSASAMAGTAGALHAHFIGAVEPNMSSIQLTVLLLCGTILSGRKHVWGAFIGAGFLIIVPEMLQRFFITEWGAHWQVFPIVQVCYGILVICVTIFIFPKIRGALKIRL